MKPLILAIILTIFTTSNYATNDLKQMKSQTAEFKFTNQELEELSRWKDKSFDYLWKDAFKCDRAALYMVGMSFLTGSADLTIDVEKADLFFSISASFGFALAVAQFIHTNIERENFFLVLVYSNLLASLDHSEYVLPYHELRTKIIATFGNDLSKEIEKIASFKRQLISKNNEKLKKSNNKQKFFIEMSYNESLINYQDDDLNYDYWVKFTKFQTQVEDEANKFQEFICEDFEEFHQLYEKSRENLSQFLKKLKNKEEITSINIDYLKDAKKALEKAKEVIALLETFQNVSNQNLRRLTKEFLLLTQNAKVVLEQHHKFILSPDEFLELTESINKLAEYTVGVKQHLENIENFIRKFN